jgi:hypothetical protein
MDAYRCAYRPIFDLSRWLAMAFAVLVLSACGTVGTGLTPTSTTKLPTPATTSHSTPVVTLAVTSLPASIAWKTYQNDRAGYTVDYPADWTIDERSELDGANVTTFAPSDPDAGGTNLTVIVRNDASPTEEIPDMPNTRCQQVAVDKLSGVRCFDTLSSNTVTTLIGPGKIYTLVGSGKRLDQNIYQRFLNSLAVKP